METIGTSSPAAKGKSNLLLAFAVGLSVGNLSPDCPECPCVRHHTMNRDGKRVKTVTPANDHRLKPMLRNNQW